MKVISKKSLINKRLNQFLKVLTKKMGCIENGFFS